MQHRRPLTSAAPRAPVEWPNDRKRTPVSPPKGTLGCRDATQKPSCSETSLLCSDIMARGTRGGTASSARRSLPFRTLLARFAQEPLGLGQRRFRVLRPVPGGARKSPGPGAPTLLKSARWFAPFSKQSKLFRRQCNVIGANPAWPGPNSFLLPSSDLFSGKRTEKHPTFPPSSLIVIRQHRHLGRALPTKQIADLATLSRHTSRLLTCRAEEEQHN